MRAAVLEEIQSIRVKDVPIPEPRDNEVLIKISLAGICGSDYSLYYGKFGVSLPVIPGHEAVGTIVRIGSGVNRLAVGQRVTIQPNFSCGKCPLCTSGHGNLCTSKIRLGIDANGVFAEYTIVPAGYVWPIPNDMPDEVAVFTEPLSVCVHALNTTAPKKGDQVMIFGAGVIGLLTLQLAVSRGAAVSAMDLSEPHLAMAKALGAQLTLGAEAPIETYFNKFDMIYETSGAPTALDLSIRLAAPKGKIVVLGLPGKTHPVLPDLIVRKELRIFGSIIYTEEFPDSINLLKTDVVDTQKLSTSRIALSDLNDALDHFHSPGRVKTLIEI